MVLFFCIFFFFVFQGKGAAKEEKIDDHTEGNHSFMQALRAIAADEFKKSKSPVRKSEPVEPLSKHPPSPKSPSPGKPAFSFWEETDDIIDLSCSGDDEKIDTEEKKLQVCFGRFSELW